MESPHGQDEPRRRGPRPGRLARRCLSLLGVAGLTLAAAGIGSPPPAGRAVPPRPSPGDEANSGREAALRRARLEQGVILAERTVDMLETLQAEVARRKSSPGRSAP